MVLSRVALDTGRRSTMAALANPQKLHGAVESCLPGGRERRLWRLDTLGGKLYLLILSENRPDLSALYRQFGGQEPPESRDYAPLLSRITAGSIWRFRLTANPTVSCPVSAEQRGTVRAHASVKWQEKWLADRAEKHGFSLPEGGFTVTGSRWLRFAKQDGEKRRFVSLLSVTYEGVLQVNDPERFTALLTGGLGRGKAYGMGLMTVMRGGVARV